MDNLARDVKMAMALGYGVHYGKYKADHPNTAYQTDEEILGSAKRKTRPRELPQQEMVTCRYCGKTFPKSAYGRQFCDDDCRRYFYDQRKREKKMGIVHPANKCVICGEPVLGKRLRKYCSPNCREIGERERYQFNLARAKMRREQKKWEGL